MLRVFNAVLVLAALISTLGLTYGSIEDLYKQAEISDGTVIEGINDYDELGKTPLLNAVSVGYLAAVLQLLKGGAQVDKPIQFTTDTPVFVASQMNFEHIVVALINHKANLDILSSNNITALHISSQMGHVAIVKSLLNANASTTSTTSDGMTPLMIAALKGNLEVIKLLIEHNPKSLHASNNFGDTILIYGVMSGDLKTVQFILSCQVDIDKSNNRGLTALMLAASRNLFKIMNQLIEAGANINQKDNIKWTALQHAKVCVGGMILFTKLATLHDIIKI